MLPISFPHRLIFFTLVDFGEVGKILRNNRVKLNKDHLGGVCDSSWIRWCFHWASAANETLQVLKRHNEGLYHMYLILTHSPAV